MTEWDDADIVMVSALEHYSYCPRQCALIHLEHTFDENIYTLRGRIVHETVDKAIAETREGVRVERGLPLWSTRLGLVGRADVVEFIGETPYPVEYKSGPRRSWGHAELQVCAQAICLEEMTGRDVPLGAVYHHRSRRRREVAFNTELRTRVEETVGAIRRTLRDARLPPALNDKRCDNCSLIESCLPSVLDEKRRVIAFMGGLFRTVEE